MVMCDILNHDIIIKVNFQNVDYDRQINRTLYFSLKFTGSACFIKLLSNVLWTKHMYIFFVKYINWVNYQKYFGKVFWGFLGGLVSFHKRKITLQICFRCKLFGFHIVIISHLNFDSVHSHCILAISTVPDNYACAKPPILAACIKAFK